MALDYLNLHSQSQHVNIIKIPINYDNWHTHTQMQNI